MAEVMTAGEAISSVKNGSSIMIGGFGRVGSPEALLAALANHDVGNLTIICNDLGSHNEGIGVVLLQNKIKKAIGSFLLLTRTRQSFTARGKSRLNSFLRVILPKRYGLRELASAGS
jgi:acyl CoA:acetate/3-ketoacid CoA transferase alpha subunit